MLFSEIKETLKPERPCLATYGVFEEILPQTSKDCVRHYHIQSYFADDIMLFHGFFIQHDRIILAPIEVFHYAKDYKMTWGQYPIYTITMDVEKAMALRHLRIDDARSVRIPNS